MTAGPAPLIQPAENRPAHWWCGAEWTVRLSRPETAGACGLMQVDLPVGSGPKPHRCLAADTVYYLLQGTLEVQVGATTRTLTPGDLLHIPPEAGQALRTLGQEACKLLVWYFPGGPERLLKRVGEPQADPAALPPPTMPADTEAAFAWGPSYGVEFSPAAECFQKAVPHQLVPDDSGTAVLVMLDRCIIKLSGSDTLGRFTLIELQIPAGAGPPLHVHGREDEAFIVLEGELEFHAAGRQQRAGVGGVVYLPRNVPHRFVNCGVGLARMLCWATPSGLDEFFLAVGELHPDPDAPLPGVTPAALERMQQRCGEFGITLLPEA